MRHRMASRAFDLATLRSTALVFFEALDASWPATTRAKRNSQWLATHDRFRSGIWPTTHRETRKRPCSASSILPHRCSQHPPAITTARQTEPTTKGRHSRAHRTCRMLDIRLADAVAERAGRLRARCALHLPSATHGALSPNACAVSLAWRLPPYDTGTEIHVAFAKRREKRGGNA